MTIGLDFETYSDVDIKTHGLKRYVEHSSFQVQLCSVASMNGGVKRLDFVYNRTAALDMLASYLNNNRTLVAQNAPFEAAVLTKLGFSTARHQWRDSAVVARAFGAGSRLEAAAPQLLGRDKLESGSALIRLFCMPNKENGGRPFTYQELVEKDLLLKWEQFGSYCDVDAELALALYEQHALLPREWHFAAVTERMNNQGWFVDVPLVERMQAQYERNLATLQTAFYDRHNLHGKLNFQSYPQLKKWCADRGVTVKSFDQTALPKLKRALLKKLELTTLTADQRKNYEDVLDLIQLKEELGGSSLSKLKTILNTVHSDGRLYGQYMHVGAGQTYRTSGRGVQMQNIPRLEANLGDVDKIEAENWSNEKMARNMRQVFRAEHPDGVLIVGDFKAVESRGLAYLSGEEWKLDAYRADRDIYKMLATTYSSFGGVAYEDVTKEQRQAGKVGELACGYGAGPRAVAGFAEKMGIDMSEAEAGTIVSDWRAANPNIVAFWKKLDDMMHQALTSIGVPPLDLPDGGKLRMWRKPPPDSLAKQHPGAWSLYMEVVQPGAGPKWFRVFHGCYYRGKDVCYYKASENKTGDLWRARMTTPPHAWYRLYGGKIAGILTQSFCRELFFHSLRQVEHRFRDVPGVKVIGQFHDEIVVEWSPYSTKPLETVVESMDLMMSNNSYWPSFPLAADIKHAHRYIK